MFMRKNSKEYTKNIYHMAAVDRKISLDMCVYDIVMKYVDVMVKKDFIT